MASGSTIAQTPSARKRPLEHRQVSGRGRSRATTRALRLARRATLGSPSLPLSGSDSDGRGGQRYDGFMYRFGDERGQQTHRRTGVSFRAVKRQAERRQSGQAAQARALRA